jgi:uncharacterized OB-fold protein
MELPAYRRTARERLGLVGEVCPRCRAKLFPPRDICPHCGGPAKEEYVFSGKGEVYSYSTLYSPPEEFEKVAPYTVALVKLEEGPLVTAQLTDVEPEELRVGLPVEMVTRRLYDEGEDGVIVYNCKFRPAV